MVRKSSLIIIFLLFVGTLFAGSPSIFIDNTFIDIGYIYPHSKKNFKFTIYNSGEAPLIIKSIIHTCGCTKLKYSKKVIPPSEKETVYGELTSYGEHGPIIKYIYVYSNDPAREKVEVRVKAYVREEVEASPHSLKIIYPLKIPYEKEISINYYGKGEFKIFKVVDELGIFKLKLTRKTKKSYSLKLSLLKEVSKGVGGFLKVETNSKRVKVLKIPVYFSKKKFFTIFPRYINLGTTSKKSIEKRVAIRALNGVHSIFVKSVEKADWFDCKILRNNSDMVILLFTFYPEKFRKLQHSVKFKTNFGGGKIDVSCIFKK